MYKALLFISILVGGGWAVDGADGTDTAQAEHVETSVLETGTLDDWGEPEGEGQVICFKWQPTGSTCGAGGCIWKQVCHVCNDGGCSYSHTNTTCMTGGANCPQALPPEDPDAFGPSDPGMAAWASSEGYTWSTTAEDWIDAEGTPLQLIIDRQFYHESNG